MPDAAASVSEFSRTAERVGEHYDALDHFYRAVWGEHVHHGVWLAGGETLEEAPSALVRFVAENARIKRGDHVCDVGCGYGATARMLVREKGAHVIGLTVSRAQTRYAESASEGLPALAFLRRDWLENRLPDASFDVVLAIESTEHMPERQRCFDEIARVLKPGGRAVVCTWLAGESTSPATRRLLLGPLASESRMQPLGTESQYRAHCLHTGLTISSFADLSDRVRGTWPRLAAQFVRGLGTRPGNVRYLLNRHRRNRLFVLTVLRIGFAFRIGALRYGVFTTEKRQALRTR